jgi:hypothetical protein
MPMYTVFSGSNHMHICGILLLFWMNQNLIHAVYRHLSIYFDFSIHNEIFIVI